MEGLWARALLGCALWAVAARCAAAQSAAAQTVHRVDEVVVTGSRTERAQAEAPVATEVITRDEIESAGAQTVADLLEEQGGLYVERSFAGYLWMWLEDAAREFGLGIAPSD